MAGYVPLFDTLITGTLYGRWPDIGLWPVLLTMADRHGVIDVTPSYIAGVTGLDVAEVEACIARFCAPDPHSRSLEHDGRRLVQLDPARGWGWRVVNHGRYREKARLMAKDFARTQSGADAARKRVPRSPPASPGLPLSNSESYSNKEPDKSARQAALCAGDLHGSLPREAWEEWLAYRRERKLPMSPRALRLHLKALQPYSTDIQRSMIESSIASGWKAIYPPRGKGGKPAEPEWRPPPD